MKSIKALVAATALAVTALAAPAFASDGQHFEFERQKWSFGGFFGQYDKAQLQRGFQVYKEVCGNCHSLSRIAFRNLVQPGGPEFPEDAVKALAESWPNQPLAEPNDEGRTTDNKGNLLTRKATLADPILGPHRNDKEARAAFAGALPPNLSVIAKARDLHNDGFWAIHVAKMLRDIAISYQEGGPDYIYNLLVNYDEPPHGMKLAEGMNYNRAFPGNQIAMAAPLSKENFVKYQDGKGSLEENARDVSAFLAWAADPALNQRKAMGWQVLLYLAITSILLYVGKRRIWSDLH